MDAVFEAVGEALANGEEVKDRRIRDAHSGHDAMVIFDDSRAVGFVGASVRGTHVPRRAGRAGPWYRPDLCTPLAHAEELHVS